MNDDRSSLDDYDKKDPKESVILASETQDPCDLTKCLFHIRVQSPTKASMRSIPRINSGFKQSWLKVVSTEGIKQGSISPVTNDSGQSNIMSPVLSASDAHSSVFTRAFEEATPWSYLPKTMQFYLNYHRNHLNHRSYFFRNRCDHFLHSTLLGQALNYDPLLFAVVGFAAFRMASENPDGTIQDFLDYYNKSVKGLRKSLAAGHTHTESMLLTILQLATFEVLFHQLSEETDLTPYRNTWETG